MKQTVKKLLSILTALALLIGVALPAGVLPAFAAEGGDDPTVTRIDFETPADGKTTDDYWYWSPGFYSNTSDDKTVPYVISFEYYLPIGVTAGFGIIGGDVNGKLVGTNPGLQPGHHTYEAQYTTNDLLALAFYVRERNKNANIADELFVWNFKVTKGGVEQSKNGQQTSWRYVKHNAKALSGCDWTAYMDTPVVTEITYTAVDQKWELGTYRDKTTGADNPYNVSYGYYLPNDGTAVKWSWPGGCVTRTVADVFTTGQHEVSGSAYMADEYANGAAASYSDRVSFTVQATAVNAAASSKLYVWGFNVAVDGVDITGSIQSLGNSYKTASASTTKFAGQYPWYNLQIPTEGDVVAYVNSAATNNESYLTRADYPFKTINAAIKALNTVEGDTVNRVIKIQGDVYEVNSATDYVYGASDVNAGFIKHTKHITIMGENGTDNLLYFTSRMDRGFGGPLTIDNISWRVKNADIVFATLGGHSLTFGEGAVYLLDPNDTNTQYGGKIYMWRYGEGTATTGTDYSISFEGDTGRVFEVYLGSNSSSGRMEATEDVNFYFNGNRIVSKLTIGPNATFNKNVNIQIDGGNVTQWEDNTHGIYLGSSTTFAEGAALQFILNNGKKMHSQITSAVTDAVGAECLYIIKSAAYNDVTLSATPAKGVYNVNGTLGAYIPVVYQNGVKVENAAYDASAKTLTVPAAGTYDVKYEKAPIRGDAVAYVKLNATTTGDIYDSNNGAVAAADANCYPTISKAITALDAVECSGKRVIKIIGSYNIGKVANGGSGEKEGTWGGFSTHANHITIEGYDPADTTALVDITGLCWVGGPTTFDNIHYYMASNNSQIRLNGANVVFGSNAVAHFGDTGYYQYYLATGRYAPGAGGNPSAAMPTGKQTVEINGQTVYTIYLGDAEPRTGALVHPTAVDFVVNGGYIVSGIAIGSSYSNGTQYSHFTNDINLTVNNGRIGSEDLKGKITVNQYCTFAPGVNVQIILNNGIVPAGSLPSSVKDTAGTEILYFLKVAKHDNGAKLATTDVAGIYDVVGDLGDLAPVVYDAEGNKVAGASYNADTKKLTIPTAGTYTVEWNSASIEVTAPTKTEYRIGEALSLSGLVVNHIAANGTKTQLGANDYTVDSSAFNANATGTYTITVSGVGAYAGMTDSFKVKVIDPTVWALKFDEGTGTTHYFNCFKGGADAATYPYVISLEYYMPNVETTFNWENVGAGSHPKEGDFTFKPGHHKMSFSFTSTRSDKNLFLVLKNAAKATTLYIWDFKVTCNGVDLGAGTANGYSAAAQISVDKSETLGSSGLYRYMDDFLEVTTMPKKTKYWLGEALDTEGLTLTYTYADGSTQTITEGFEISGYDSNTVGTQTLKVSCNEYVIATFEVKVEDPTGQVYYFDFDSVDYATELGLSKPDLNHVRKILYRPHNLSVSASSGTIEYTFEYYMPEQSSIYVCVGNNENQFLTDKETGSAFLQQGHHTFTCTFNTQDYSHDNMYVAFATTYNPYADDADGSRDGKLGEFSLFPQDIYVWNVKMTNKTTGAVRGTTYANAQGIAANYMSTTEEFDKRTTVDKSYVYELDFSNMTEHADATAWMPPVIPLGNRPANDANEYVISFDYFLDKADARVRAFFDPHDGFVNADGGSALRNIAEGENNDYNLDAGRHSFKAVITRDMIASASGCAPYLRFELNYGEGTVPAKLYIWNVKFACTSGNDTIYGNLLEGAPVFTSSTNCTVTRTAIAPEKLSSVDELDLYGAQVRDDKALRFVAAIKDANIIRQDNGEALYGDTATITIAGITYKVMGAGILFGRDVKIADLGKAPEDAMTLGNVGGGKIYKIPAAKLQKQEYHAAYLGQGVQGVVFTGVITNMPRANWGESLSARVYMELVDPDGNAVTYYGGIISRSLNKVLEATRPNNLNPNELMSSTDEMNEAAAEFKAEYFGDGNTAIPANATVYKVSNDDAGALRTLDEVNALSAGTSSKPVVVLFERGGEYRGHIEVKDYTTYGAYGEGAKPFINASLMNYADTAALRSAGLSWVKCDEKYGNRWQLDGMRELLDGDANIGTKVGNNVGSMYFFDQYGDMIAYGSKSMSANIYQDYEFYHDIKYFTYPDNTVEVDEKGNSLAGEVVVEEFGDLYVYLPEGKSPTDYAKIEIAHKQSAIVGSSTGKYDPIKNVTVDNLCVKYTGVHGVSFSSGYEDAPVSNITITNCEIGWIGGSIMRYDEGTADYKDDDDVRLGNGIELNGNIDGAVVSNNWIYQCYDAGYSNQGTSGIAQDITVNYNLIEYCAYSIEIWESSNTGLMKNCHYDNNFMRFAGYEFERDNRIGGALTAISHVNFMHSAKPCENVTVSGNVFDTSYSAMVVIGYPNTDEMNEANDNAGDILENLFGSTFESDKKGPAVSGNTWVQGYDCYSYLAYLWQNADIDDKQEKLSASSQADMEQNISKKISGVVVDETPKKVVFYK